MNRPLRCGGLFAIARASFPSFNMSNSMGTGEADICFQSWFWRVVFKSKQISCRVNKCNKYSCSPPAVSYICSKLLGHHMAKHSHKSHRF
jgi:hypothetical protein